MGYARYILSLLDEAYQLPDWAVNPPKDTDHWLDRLIWIYETLGRGIQASKKSGEFRRDLLRMINSMKRIVGGVVREYAGVDPGKEYREYKKSGYVPDSEWDYTPYDIIDKASNDSKDPKVKRFLVWYLNAFHTDIKQVAKNPKADFEKLYPKVMKLFRTQVEQEGQDFKWRRFLSRLAGQDSPKLRLKDQRYLKAQKLVPDYVWEFLTGRSDRPDLSAELHLDSRLDLFVFPNLPAGGRIAQTIPELLLVTFYKSLKQQTLGMSFSLNKFMSFIRRFIGRKIVTKWTKVGTVYRIGKIDTKRDWYPASTSLEGIKEFVLTWHGRVDDFEVSSGKVKYFDLTGYMSWLMKELGYDPHGDPELEVFVPKGTKFQHKATYRFNQLRGRMEKV